MRPKGFVTRRIPQAGLDILEKECEVRVNPYDRVLTKDELIEGIKGIDGLLCLLTDAIDKEITDKKAKKQSRRGGERLKKINRPISLGKEGFPRKKVLKIIFSVERFPQKMNDVFYEEDKDEEKSDKQMDNNIGYHFCFSLLGRWSKLGPEN